MPDRPRRLELGAASLLLALHVGLGLSASARKNAVFDEVAYVPVGYAYWRTGRYAQSREHPPAAKLLVGLPLLALQPNLDEASFLRDPSPGFEFGRRFLYASGNDADALILAARLPVLALSALAGAALYAWGRRRIGGAGALLALALYALDPNLLAHAGLATLDVPLAAFSLLCVASFDRHLETGRRGSLLASGLFLGLAVGSKAPGLLLVPLLILLAFRMKGWRAPAIAIAIGAATLLALYLPFGEPGAFLEAVRHPFLLSADPVPAGEPYRVFFWGEYASPGFYLYYLGAMALKTPLPTIALVLLGGVAGLRRGARRTAILALLPAAAFVAAASIGRRDVGLRYILPAYPFLFLLAGHAAGLLSRWSVAGKALGAALLGWLAIGTARAHPDFIPTFNEIGGGSRGGIRFLDDSNVDWGQDLRSLARWVGKQRPPEYRYHYFGQADPAYHGLARPEGIDAVEILWPREEVAYAVSAHILQRPEIPVDGLRGLRFRWLDRFAPETTFGDSIYLYRIRFAGARAMDRLEWLEGGIRQGEEVLAGNPPGAKGIEWLRLTLASAYEEAARIHAAASPPRAADAARARARARELAGR